MGYKGWVNREGGLIGGGLIRWVISGVIGLD